MKMKLKKIFFIVLVLAVVSCKTKKEENTDFKIGLTEVEDISKSLKFIFTNGFDFTEFVRVDKIGVQRIGKDTFKVFYFFKDSRNIQAIEDLSIAFRVYPENPEEFKSKSDEENMAKTIAVKCKVKKMGNEMIVSTDEFVILPKNFKETKVYLYKPDTGVVGNTMTILGLNLDF